MGKISEKSLKEILSRSRTEQEALSPLIFKKVDLRGADVNLEEIILQFRKATYLDAEELREKYGVDNILAAFDQYQLETIMTILSNYLTNDSIRELLKIKFVKIGNDGKEIEMPYTIDQRLKRVLASDPGSMADILDIFLRIQGMTKEQIEILFDQDAKLKSAKKSSKKKTHTVTPSK